MKHVHISAETYKGVVDLIYNDLGLLEKMDMSEASLTKEQQIWLLSSIPINIVTIKDINNISTKIKVTEIKLEITFDMAWNRYDDKQTSSKKKALIKWERMPESEKIKAYNYIPRYFNSLGSGIRKKYLETYLNSELWNN